MLDSYEDEAVGHLDENAHGKLAITKRLPIDDVAGMQVALRRLLPGVEVENIFGWDWAADPYARDLVHIQTWSVDAAVAGTSQDKGSPVLRERRF